MNATKVHKLSVKLLCPLWTVPHRHLPPIIHILLLFGIYGHRLQLRRVTHQTSLSLTLHDL